MIQVRFSSQVLNREAEPAISLDLKYRANLSVSGTQLIPLSYCTVLLRRPHSLNSSSIHIYSWCLFFYIHHMTWSCLTKVLSLSLSRSFSQSRTSPHCERVWCIASCLSVCVCRDTRRRLYLCYSETSLWILGGRRKQVQLLTPKANRGLLRNSMWEPREARLLLRRDSMTHITPPASISRTTNYICKYISSWPRCPNSGLYVEDTSVNDSTIEFSMVWARLQAQVSKVLLSRPVQLWNRRKKHPQDNYLLGRTGYT